LKGELRLDTKYIGDLNIQTYSGVVEEKGYQTTAVIEGLGGRKVDFIVSNCQQSIPEYQYDIPAAWKRKYKLPENPKSKYGMNMITLGKDNCGLFPVIIEVNQGVCVSQSNITGNFKRRQPDE
jgi:hypothetical protein